MRIAVIGSGGVGGYYGGMWARVGEDVTLIARGPHLRAIQTSGLTVKTAHVGEFTVDVHATDDPSTVSPVRWSGNECRSSLSSFVVMTVGTVEVTGPQAAVLESPAGVARARVISTELLESIPCLRARHACLA